MNTIQCNQKCTKCSHWKHKDRAGRLPIEKIVSAIKSIPTATELCIVGGEPLLHKSEIYEILQSISYSAIRTVIITNGVSMGREFVHTVSEYNVHIVVSIDTIDRDFWKFVRGVNSMDMVLKNFEYAVSVLSPAQISIQSVLSKETHEHVADVADYARSKRIHHSVQNYISEGFEGSWTPVDNCPDISPDRDQQCFAVDRNLSIVQNGDVFTCFQQPWIEGCEMPLGNLNVREMTEILSSEYVDFVSRKMRACNLPCKVLKCNVRD